MASTSTTLSLLRLFATFVLLIIAVGSSSRVLGSPLSSTSQAAPSLLPLPSKFQQVHNVRRGLYISTSPNEANFWLSNSRGFAFGFYPLCDDSRDACSRHVVGIWLFNSQQGKSTLVWSLNHNSPPLIGPSSIHFTDDGQFLLRAPNGEEQYLFGTDLEPASYAELLDDGNFVIYNSESVIMWKSFDHPTDTLLSGQTLRPWQTLYSSTISTTDKAGDMIYKLVMQGDGKIVLYSAFAAPKPLYTPYWVKEPWVQPKNSVTLELDSMGGLYLVSHDNVILRSVRRQWKNHKEDGVLYRVTLGTDGYLRLFMERRIRSQGGGGWKTTQLWFSFQEEREDRKYLTIVKICSNMFLLAFAVFLLASHLNNK